MDEADCVQIRMATADDAGPLAALAARTWADAFAASLEDPGDAQAELDDGRSEARFAAMLAPTAGTASGAPSPPSAPSPRVSILVATRPDGTLIGYAESGPVDIPEAGSGPDDRALRRLYVETALHGRGIGRALLHAALTRPPLARAPRVFLQVWERNVRAVALYESAGFAAVATTRFTIGDSAPMEDLVMMRRRPGGVS